MSNQFQNIPDELKALHQWCLWRYEDIGAAKPTKIPYSTNGKMASVTDPTTWSDFNSVVLCFNRGGYDGIGFIFTDNDPFTFLDLDAVTDNKISAVEKQAIQDRQLKVFKEFDSYSEISPSGEGLHIIIKGSIPAGRRRSYIEVYCSKRYATFTGNVYHNVPIAYRQDKLSQLWEQMGAGGVATHIYKGDDKEIINDAEVISRATKAVNGDKFELLLHGKWQDIYGSQSEADFAFIDIIAYYTQNRNQITRIFRASELGKRDKAKRNDYVSWMVNKSFDRMLPPIDLDGFKNAIEVKLNAEPTQEELPLGGSSQAVKATGFDPVIESSNLSSPSNNGRVAQRLEPAAHNGSVPGSNPGTSTIPIPPGLLGEIAQFIYRAAPRPIPEIALAGAMGLMAGIAGRAYNISGTGLNQYILMIANTGSGKEGAASGIDKLMNAIRLQVPTSTGFIGPSEIASGQALVKFINKQPCFVSLLGEFGLRLQAMSSNMASGSEIALRRMILDLFAKSGHGQVFRPSIYSDKDKNIDATLAPAFSILAESTPERFYSILNEEMISEGLLPRFMLIEYNGLRPALNAGFINSEPPMWLVDKLASLAANCEMIMHAKRVIDVKSDKYANEIFNNFEKFSTDHINSLHNQTNKEVLRQLWNRAHIKALKISALIAVGVNMSDPIITTEYAKWAINIVENDIKTLSARFESGEVGTSSSEGKQQSEVIRAIKDYFSKGFEVASKYAANQHLYHARLVSYSYLSRKLLSNASFKTDRIGATGALKRTIQTMIDSDKIREIGKSELMLKFGTTQRAFIVSDLKILD